MAYWHLAPWGTMWLMAGAVYAAAKLATLARRHALATPAGPLLTYLFLSPSMDPLAFHQRLRPTALPARLAFTCCRNILAGACLLWLVPRHLPETYPLLRGWMGMIGM